MSGPTAAECAATSIATVRASLQNGYEDCQIFGLRAGAHRLERDSERVPGTCVTPESVRRRVLSRLSPNLLPISSHCHCFHRSSGSLCNRLQFFEDASGALCANGGPERGQEWPSGRVSIVVTRMSPAHTQAKDLRLPAAHSSTHSPILVEAVMT